MARHQPQHDAVPLKTYTDLIGANLQAEMDRRITAVEREISQRFEDLNKSIEATRITMDLRLTAMNEFRDALRDREARFATTAIMDARLASVDKQLDANDARVRENAQVLTGLREAQAALQAQRKDSQAGTAILWQGIAAVLFGISILVTILGVTHHL